MSGESTTHKSKPWQHKDSIAARKHTPAERLRAARKRKEFDAEQRSLERWYKDGFSSQGEEDG